MQNIIHQSLDGTWKLAIIHQADFIKMKLPVNYAAVEAAGAIDGKVPGNFEIDLEKAGKIQDPFFGTNILKMFKYEDCHIFYARKFDYKIKEGEKPEFVFEGIDTLADIYLNGQFLAHTDNMYVTHLIDGKDIKNGENEIVVHIKPVCLETRKNNISAGQAHLKYNYECIRLRKAPSMFGWDITPRLVSAGIYRSAGIYQRPAESFKQCYLMTRDTDPARKTASAELFYDFDIGNNNVEDYSITVKGKCGASEFSASSRLWFPTGKLRIDIEGAEFWSPKGYGKPNLYNVEVTLEKNSKAAASYKFKTGLRTVKLVRTGTTDISHNGAFHFVINGRKVFIMGTNWVPVDSYHSRDKERIPKIMELLKDIGCNAVRCWGGNIYEDPLFYQYCDEMGVMVWQDFAMACGIYPTDEEFKRVIYNEAVSIIRSLRQHPSIILWSGDNEDDQFIAGDGYGRDPNQNKLTREVLPDAVYNEDPTRPYLPSSPYIDEEAAKLPQAYLSENHLWGPRDYFKSQFYKGSLSHFASEMGYHGSVSKKSMKHFISPEKFWPWQDNDEWLIHSASPETDKSGSYVYRIELMAKQIKELFGVIPENLEDFIIASQISQAEAKKFFVELFRTQSHRSGLIWWNLIDGWPQWSDAVVDYNFYKKLAYYYLRQSQKPLILTFAEPHDWMLPLCATNLSGTGTLEFSYQVKDFASDKTVLSGKGSCKDQECFELASLPYSQGEKKIYLIEWESQTSAENTYSGKNHYLAGNPPFELSFYKDFLKKTYSSWYGEIFE
ncbi:beta-mannosidase [Spirochaetia bacterium]|nr:beta-mannosidase [Spirochaetia bacterium]